MGRKAKSDTNSRARTQAPDTFRDRVVGFERVRAGDLVADAMNWRTHPPGQRAALDAILSDVGFAGAILCRRLDDGRLRIIDGHLRAETAPDSDVPVLVTDLDETEAALLLAVHDPIAAMAGGSSAALAELAEMAGAGSDALRGLIEATQAALAPAPDAVIEDDAPEPLDDPITQLGDIWVLGNHRLMCGDSGSAEDLDRLLDGEVIHLVDMDPPYNFKVEPRSNNAIAAGLSSFTNDKTGVKALDAKGMHHSGFDVARGKSGLCHHQKSDLARRPERAKATHKKMRAKDRPLEGDFVSDDDFARMLRAWFGNAARVLAPGRSFYIWGGYANCSNYPPALKECGLHFSQAVIWVKEHPALTRKDFLANHEWCFYGWKKGAAHWFNPEIHNATDVWSVKKVHSQSMVHLTEKPVELAVRAMTYSSKPGENVLDLFGGSGSTLIGAEHTGRRAYLMELDPPYCDVIVKRFEEYTGKKATLEATGETFPETK